MALCPLIQITRIMADAMLTKLLDEPAINWANSDRLEHMIDRRNKYIVALRAADGRGLSALLKFSGA